jgi:hypothetical protein
MLSLCFRYVSVRFRQRNCPISMQRGNLFAFNYEEGSSPNYVSISQDSRFEQYFRFSVEAGRIEKHNNNNIIIIYISFPVKRDEIRKHSVKVAIIFTQQSLIYICIYNM